MKELAAGQKAKVKVELSSIRSIEIDCEIKWSEPDRVALTFPEDKLEYASYFLEGQEIMVTLYTLKGIRIYESIVIDSPFEGDFTVEYYEGNDEEYVNVQRREFVRVQTEQPITLFINGEKKPIQATTIDIGGGGLRLCTNKEIFSGDILNFILYPRNWHQSIKGSAEVIKTTKNDNITCAVLRYINVKEFEMNKIFRLCFEIQAQQLRER